MFHSSEPKHTFLRCRISQTSQFYDKQAEAFLAALAPIRENEAFWLT